MKRVLLLVACLVVCSNALADTNSLLLFALDDDGTNFVVAQDDKGKYGYKIKGEDKYIIKPKYLEARPFSDGVAIVSTKGKEYPVFGTINIKGKYVIKPKYKTFEDYVDGLAKVETDNGWGLINRNGDVVLEPIFSVFENYIGELARIKTDSGWGLVNRRGEIVLNPVYSIIEEFSDGLARVQSANGWGVIDEDGNEIINPIYKSVDFRESTYIWECVDENGFIALYDSNGELYWGTEKQTIFQELVNDDIYIVSRDGFYYLLKLDQTGLQNLGGFDDVREFGRMMPKSFFLVRQEGKYGLMSSWGEWISDAASFDDVDTSYAPNGFIFRKDGCPHLYDSNKGWFVNNGEYNTIKKGYLNDWIFVGETKHEIVSGDASIKGNGGTNDNGFSIEMVDNPRNVEGSYLILNISKKSIRLVYTDGNTLDSRHEYNKEYLVAMWNVLPNDIKQSYASPVKIPDEHFKAYCVEWFDLDGDGELSYLEVMMVRKIKCIEDDIASLDGIEHFTELNELDCANNKITNLNLSKNPNLVYLNCNDNQLTSLDVSKNSQLADLYCGSNRLTSLDVSNNPNLEKLGCSFNQLTSLDLSKNPKLADLYCSSNRLTSLDVSNNPNLKELNCYTNRLTSLDVSNNPNLENLLCLENQLIYLNVSKNSKMWKMDCSGNQLTSLDVSNNQNLVYLYCSGNQLTSLDVSNNPNLALLLCGDNQLTSLDVSDNSKLWGLNCRNNQLKSLNMGDKPKLKGLYCSSNRLTSLDVSNNPNLEELDCSSNRLTYLNVSNCTALSSMFCFDNKLTRLEMGNNELLKSIKCYGNQLTSLDVSTMGELRLLECQDNPNLQVVWLKKGKEYNTDYFSCKLLYDKDTATVKYK